MSIQATQNKGWRFETMERYYLDEVLKSGFGASESGTFNERLEKLFAELHDRKYAVAANSGTSTLHMALIAGGVKPGDEVLIPALGPAMTGYSVWQSGATPVYVDIKPDTFLMNIDDARKKITRKTKAIIPVHLYGLMCDMTAVTELARLYSLHIVEDCAQCIFAHDEKGRLAGTIGHVGSWSFENSKHLSTGDGGIVATNDENLATRMRQFGGVGFKNIKAQSGKVRIDRNLFQDPDWERHNIMAYNYRMPELCAAVGLAQLEKAEWLCKLRILMGESYLRVIGENEMLKPQYIPTGFKNSYYTFAALFNPDLGVSWKEFRAKYMEFGGDGIFAAWQCVNREPAFRGIGWGVSPVAEKLQRNLMQFTTNQHDEAERHKQAETLMKTLDFFKRH